MSPAPKNEPNMPPRLSEESLKEIGALSETGTALLRKGRHAQVRTVLFTIFGQALARVIICVYLFFWPFMFVFGTPFILALYACVHTRTHTTS
jgi:hypothetical protein